VIECPLATTRLCAAEGRTLWSGRLSCA
jgi:hypothetical protein